MNFKKGFISVLALLLVLLMTGCSDATNKANGSSGDSSGEKFTIKLASYYASNHPQTEAAKKFKELVEDKTQNNVTVEIYPDSQLGSEDSYIPSVKNGTVEMGIAGTMIGNEGSPLISVIEMPFLFEGWDHVKDVLSGEIGKELADPLLEKSGIKGLAWSVNGFREVSSNKPIEKMEDFKGLKLRVPNVPNYVEMAKGLGASPVTMSLTELFTALEQGTVDGQDNPFPTNLASSFYEVQKYMLETRHVFSPALWVINDAFYQSLPEDYQTIVAESANEASEYNWEISKEYDESAKEQLIEHGVTIKVPDEQFKQELRDSQKDVEQWFYKEYPGSEELVEKIRNTK
ncbi:TRAP transporter substrate-binding protein [Psychrobacillus sp. FSL K6-2836]|uniref:TRAP transporter substrate-binding protein n=1 Tax=Psychrobacillus sp. FSL K6-2836 TaxID=2921548 RepID=UPI0030FB8C90